MIPNNFKLGVDTRTLSVLMLWGLRSEKRRGYPTMKPSFCIEKEILWKQIYQKYKKNMPFKNKEEKLKWQRKYNKTHYYKHRESYIATQRKRKDSIRKWFTEYKMSLRCFDCSERHFACLDFHHVNPKEKENGVSLMVFNANSIEKIKKEISKCIVLCKNCHAKRHYNEIHTGS